MPNRILILPLVLVLGAAATFVSAQPQRPPAAQGQPGRAAPQRPLPSPEQRAERRADLCKNINARAAGNLAALEVRLELTANQRAAFNRWRDVRLAAAKRRADSCATAPIGPGRGGRGPAANAQATPPNPAERLARQEQMLRQRLADITAERPALEALYASLTPEQRADFRPEAGPRRGFGGRGMGRGGPLRQRIMMLRDRTGGPRGGDVMIRRGGPGGRMGAGGPDMPPPPPPAR